MPTYAEAAQGTERDFSAVAAAVDDGHCRSHSTIDSKKVKRPVFMYIYTSYMY